MRAKRGARFMSKPPANPKIYHITHVKNLPKIVEAGCLWSDAKRIELGLETKVVGMSDIKRRRLEENQVTCNTGTMVGQYVPFYYCPRSIMLYILYKGNHIDLDYAEGQGPMIHLQADLRTSVNWAQDNNVAWASSLSNAGTRYAEYFNTMGGFPRIDWSAVANRDFRSPSVKEGKQAEFLVFESFPWSMVEHVGVFDQNTRMLAHGAITASTHKPTIRTENSWYF